MATTPRGPVTGDELLQHRLVQLEEWRVESASTIRSTERDVDLLKLESGTVKGLLVELRTEVRERDEHTRTSLARLHERLDKFGKEVNDRLAEVQAADAHELGREAGEKTGRAETLKLVGWTFMATVGGGGLVVALLTLVL